MNYERLNKMTKKQMYAFIANLINVGLFDMRRKKNEIDLDI